MTGTDGPPFDPGMVIPGIARTLDPRTERSVTGRLALALAGGLPIGIAVGWLLGELTGCGRFAATCDPGVVSLAWVVTFVVIAALVLVPSVAAIAAFGALGALLAGVPATVLLTVTGGSRMPDASAAVLGVILIVGWLAGVAAGTNRLRRRPAGPGPVS